MSASELLPIIALVGIVTVEWGGWALLKIVTGREAITPYRQRFLRAGHAHAGVLLTLSLVYFLYLPRAEFYSGVEWAAGIVMLVGVQTQAGGFFVQMARGEDGRSLLGARLTRIGAIVIAIALIALAVGLALKL